MALSKPRDTWTREPDLLVLPVAAAKVIHQGGIVCVSATGYATPGAVATTLKAAGRAEESADNTGGADGALSVTAQRGVFRFKNSATDPLTQADVLSDCYIADDETVAKTSGANTLSKAGKVLEVEAAGVWVEIR